MYNVILADPPFESDYDYWLARSQRLTTFRPNLFFMGLNPRWQMYRFLPRGLNVMFSASGFWDDKEGKWRKKKFKRSFGLKWLDCGGFTMLNQYGDYPFSVTNYANLIARLKPHYYASMDYPCEPEISRQLGLMTNHQRIRETINNAIELASWENQLSGQFVPVIQGYTTDEYLYCLELYDQMGLIRDYMAAGSMCRRISDKELSVLIPSIYYKALSLGCSKLHFFGLKLSPSLLPYSGSIAFASFVAFASAGITDTLVYWFLGARGKLLKINGSNLLSSGVDSVVFPALAFGFPLLWWVMLGQFLAKVIGGFIWSLVITNKLRQN